MKNYWHNLNERERLMLVIGSVCLIAYLFYLLIYAPLHAAVTKKTQEFIEKKETLSWMKHARTQRRLNKAPQRVNNTQLLALLSRQLRGTSFRSFVYQIQQAGNGDIQLFFEQVPFNAFLLWLYNLSEKYTISVKQIQVERTDTLGIARIQVVMTGG